MIRAHAWLLSLFVLACDLPEDSIAIAQPDRDRFVSEAYPVLLADCGFPACHGTSDRFFAVYGPGRTRLDGATGIYDPPTEDELDLSFSRAASMLQSPDGPRRSPLLRKPLAVSAGGQSHAGDDPWGNAIYPSKSTPGYEALFRWAVTAEVP